MSREIDSSEAFIEDGCIVMKVPLTYLQNVVRYNSNLCDDFGGTAYNVTNPAKFAEDLVNEINCQDETGANLFTIFFDQAVENAIENGCEGVEAEEGDDE